jgi:hypothetical protein
MTDWIGTLRIRGRAAGRLELCLTRSTVVAGWVTLLAGLAFAGLLWRWQLPRFVFLLPGIVALLGAVLITLRRDLVFDRDDGVLRIEQRLLGIASRSVVPLFHLRAVVISARTEARVGPRYVSYLDRRIGSPIHLDEAQRCASLLPIAEAISEVTELRLVYDATTRDVAAT